MDAWPEFYLEEPYDWTTFHEVMEEVATQFPAGWRRYHGIESPDPLLVGDTDARDLMKTANRLVRAAERLSDRKLPDDQRQRPKELASKAREQRRKKEALIRDLRKVAEEVTDPDEGAKLERIIDQLQGPSGLWSKEEEYRVFRSFLEIESFERYGVLPGDLADRVITLLGYLVGTDSQGARRYLERVAECFVLGLGAELAIMSRAVLESALKSLELEVVVEEIKTARDVRHASLVDWIEAASQAGLFDEHARAAADAVKQAGNNAVHAAPGIESDPEQILQSLVLVLESLEEAESR